MKRKDKTYQIQYIFSNNKTIVRGGKRGKVVKEWDLIIDLSGDEIFKFLKLNKGKEKEKYKDVNLVEVKFIDWVGVELVNKEFNKEVKIESESENKKEL